ncbi:MAG TPA: YggT family protein [Candidatus Macondimonas sp.]|nr:YggT family protein [Candidatus Macondimonas sp.]
MPAAYWQDPVLFLLLSLFKLAAVLFWVRLMVVLTARDRFDPLLRTIVRMTEPVLAPLRRVVPNYRGHDLGALLVLIALQIGLYLAFATLTGAQLPIALLPRYAAADLTVFVLNLYSIAILVQVLLSWLGSAPYPPAALLLFRLTGPLLDRARRLLPDTGAIDFSPILVLFVIQFLKRFIAPLGTGL